jgi:hypothetical protein
MGTVRTWSDPEPAGVDLTARMHHAAARLPVDGVRDPLPTGVDIGPAIAAANEVLMRLAQTRPSRPSSRWVRKARRTLTGRPSDLDVALQRSIDALVVVAASLNHLVAEQSMRFAEHEERLVALALRAAEAEARLAGRGAVPSP